ncbi:MAG: putative DNA binding domain-containing protein [Caldilineales bacterium]|nr:putative DNA binding domain-containing protein [Caldilineales bacterium]
MSKIQSNRPTASQIEAGLAAGAGDNQIFLNDGPTPRKIAEQLAALANAQGGLLIIGVSASGAVHGVKYPDQIQDRISSALMLIDPPLILPQAEVISLDGAQVCAVRVPGGLPNAYSMNGQYLVRAGARNRPLTPDELRRLLVNRSEASYESGVLADATLDDLDQEQVHGYAEQIESFDFDAETLLLSRGCLAETDAGVRPTIAGLLLFAGDPQRWLRSAEITCVRYPGRTMSDDFVRQDIRGTLPDQIRRAEAFVSTNMRRGMRIRGLSREETPEYPISVVREAIVNAVAHRDYSIRGDNIRVIMYSDRLEVYSPGRLPGHVTLANLLHERYSRNEAVVHVLSEMRFIERLGYGIDRMIAVCEQEGLPAPTFEETAAGFLVVIFGHGPDLVGAPPPTAMWSHLNLNLRQEQALTFLQQNRRITNSDYQQLCPDASPETLRRDFADLVDRGILLKIGEKRATYYVLK